MFKPLFSALFCSFLSTAHLPCGLDCLKQEHMRRSCCWNAPTPRAELKAQRCLFCLLQVLQGVSQSQANPLLIYVSQRHQAMPSKSLISKSPFILHLSSEISTTQLQQICFVPTKCYFSELNFWRAAVWALPSLLATFTASSNARHPFALEHFSIREGRAQGWHNRQHQQRPHLIPEILTPCPWHSDPTSAITSKSTLKCMVKSLWHLGRTDHLKIHKQSTKSLKICLHSSMHSAGLSFLKYLTRQSRQTKQAFYFCCFYGISP